MHLEFKRAKESELKVALSILKDAAINLQSRNINQWKYWLDPTEKNIKWVKEGFLKKEFYFIINSSNIIGMFRLMDEDLLYWGKEKAKAKYIHSLVIKVAYSGNNYGEKVINILVDNAIKEGIHLLRLDCNASNKALCKYYEKQGFIKIREKQLPDALMALYEKSLG